MGIAVNVSLIVAATIILVCSMNYFYRETNNRAFMLVMGIFGAVWCAGSALMGFSTHFHMSYLWRAVSLVGVDFFLVSEAAFICHITNTFRRFRKPLFIGTGLAALADLSLFTQWNTVTLLRYHSRTCYYMRSTPARIIHSCFVLFLIALLVYMGICWYRRVTLKRDKRTVITLFLANVIFLISCIPDTLLPRLGYPSFPGSCYGVLICYMAIWFVSTRLNAFHISVRNISNYIYQQVNSSVLVFDNEERLAMANNYAHQFLDIAENAHPLLSDLFQISTEDAELVFVRLRNGILPENLRLIARNNQAVCSLRLNLANDAYGDPYGTICFVYDLSKEEEILNEVNQMKDLLQEDLKEKTYQVECLTLQSITTIANTIDAKDSYTKGHSSRVSEYSARLAESLGWSQEAIQNLKYIALLHDIGKISVPDSILNKPDRLTPEEYEIIKSHTTVGGEILKDISMIQDVADGAQYHHERYDGKGYPIGLTGEAIPIVARIICIADSYDAMNSKRVYRDPLPPEKIRAELLNGRGTQFDPYLLDQFLVLFDNHALELPANAAGDTIANESSKLLDQILSNIEQEKERNDQSDYLTGLLNRKNGEAQIKKAMQRHPGALAFVDLDNLKVINDTIGHTAGDHALTTLAEVLQTHSHNTIITRIGGDEFLYYMQNVDENAARTIIEGIIHSFRSKKENDRILRVSSVSVGICLTTPEDSYEDVYQNADKALYYVKQNGKDGYYIYNQAQRNTNMTAVDLKKLVFSMSRQGSYHGSLGVEYREFAKFYEYINNLVDRYDHDLQLIMLTISPKDTEHFSLETQEDAMNDMSSAINNSLRNVDICTRFSSEQFLIILLNAEKINVEMIAKRIFDRFRKAHKADDVTLSYDIADLSLSDYRKKKS